MNFLSFYFFLGEEGVVFNYQNMVLENCSDLNINMRTFFQKYFLSSLEF